MNQFELEKLLFDLNGPEELSKIAEELRPQIGEYSSPTPLSKVKPVGDTPWSVKAKPEEIAKTDLKNNSRSGLLEKIGDYLPALKNKTPRKALKLLIDRLAETPSADNQYLVLDAINRLTYTGALNKKSEETVKKAIEGLLELWGKDPDTTGAVYTNLHEHADFTGRSIFSFLGTNAIYRGIRSQYLKNVGLHDAISSFTFDSTKNEGRGDMILFQDDRYFGRFFSVRTQPNDASQQVSVPYVGDFINDRTSSVLMVRHFEGEKMAAIGTDDAKMAIRNIIEGMGQISVREDPIFTWDMWPTGGDSHPNDPDKRFIQVKIPVLVDPLKWPWDYNAEIWLWLYLYISNGELKGYLAHYGAWVSGGLISGRVLDDIMDALPGHFGTIDALLDVTLRRIDVDGPFQQVYLLPGDQSLFTGNSFQGHVNDNVSVVLVPERLPLRVNTSISQIF